MRFIIASVLGAALASYGCSSTEGTATTALPGDDVVSRSVLGVGFERIADVYVDPVDIGELTVDGLAGLGSIDDRITADRMGGAVRLLLDGQTVANFPAPESNDTGAWSALAVATVGRGRAASPLLQAADAEAIYAAVFEAVAADLDPYSRYVDPEQARQDRAYRDGYGGIGLLIDVNDADEITIVDVFPEGPAFRAGITILDRIVAVDGTDATGWSLETLGNTLRGPVDTDVTVTLRGGDGRERVLTLTREKVVPNAVSTLIEGQIAVVRVSRFNAATADHLEEALVELRETSIPPLRGIVLDLRGNPGGLLDQSVAVADMFIPRGQIIRTSGRHPDSIQEFVTQRGDLMRGLPLVVLVDGRSASGSEVVAAALQDSGRAVVVGSSTFGKGSVQTVTRLPNDGELFLTWSLIYAPSGYTLHRQGVLPTICTSQGIDDANQIITLLTQGELDTPITMAPWRMVASENDDALEMLRETCPYQDHEPELDEQVALRLLEQPTVYRQALAAARPATLAQR